MTRVPGDYKMPPLDRRVLQMLTCGPRLDTDLAALAPGWFRSTRLRRCVAALGRLGERGWVIGYFEPGPSPSVFYYRLTDGAIRRLSAWRAER